MLTGRAPFAGDDRLGQIAAILEREPDWTALPATRRRPFAGCCARCLEKDPKRRLRDIGDVRFELDDALAGGDGFEPRAPATVDRAARRWRWIAVGALAATIGLFALVTGAFRGTPPAAGSAPSNIVVSQLTSYDGTEASGALSPDGRAFAFVSNHDGTPDIWVRQVAGGEPVRLTNDATAENDLVYAPNGETIHFTRIDGADRSIWRIGALGGQPRKVLGNAFCPSPSPDGRRIAWFATGPGAPFSGALR